MRPAVICIHPSACTAEKFCQVAQTIEEQTGRPAVLHANGRITLEEAYEDVDRQAYLGKIGAFPKDAA